MAQTREDLIELIDFIYKETYNWNYQLIDSLNYPEIDIDVRIIRLKLIEFEDTLARIKREINTQLIKRDKQIEEHKRTIKI